MKALYAYGLMDAQKAISAGEITSAALTASCLERVSKLEDRVHAWAWLNREHAVECAMRADEQRQQSEGKLGPLHGLPLGIKDIVATQNIPTAMGSPVFAHNLPAHSADVVNLLHAAGAFVIGKTVTAECAFLSPGKTTNPWNPAHTPGGSSSGSAAAVAAGFVPAALGTQTNGSMMRPAAYCGIVGYKPSKGLISGAGVFSFSRTLDQLGVFTRSVADAAYLSSCLSVAAPNGGKVVSSRIEPITPPPRIAAIGSPVWNRAEPAQQEMFLHNLSTLRGAGAEIEERELPDKFSLAHAVLRTIMAAEGAHEMFALQNEHRNELSQVLNDFLDEGREIKAVAYLQALQLRSELKCELEGFLSSYDAIITPPATGEAPATLAHTGDPSFCTIWNLCGVPTLSIPCGLGPQGLPLGLQIVGAEHHDDLTLAVAQWCEKQFEFIGLV